MGQTQALLTLHHSPQPPRHFAQGRPRHHEHLAMSWLQKSKKKMWHLEGNGGQGPSHTGLHPTPCKEKLELHQADKLRRRQEELCNWIRPEAPLVPWEAHKQAWRAEAVAHLCPPETGIQWQLPDTRGVWSSRHVGVCYDMVRFTVCVHLASPGGAGTDSCVESCRASEENTDLEGPMLRLGRRQLPVEMAHLAERVSTLTRSGSPGCRSSPPWRCQRGPRSGHGRRTGHIAPAHPATISWPSIPQAAMDALCHLQHTGGNERNSAAWL